MEYNDSGFGQRDLDSLKNLIRSQSEVERYLDVGLDLSFWRAHCPQTDDKQEVCRLAVRRTLIEVRCGKYVIGSLHDWKVLHSEYLVYSST